IRGQRDIRVDNSSLTWCPPLKSAIVPTNRLHYFSLAGGGRMNFTNLIWLFFLISTVMPMFQQYWVAAQRVRLIRKIERERQSRVITLIHRQESVAFLGIPIARYISIEDSEALLRAIRLTPDDMPIDIVLHTPGGLVLAAEQIAEALIRHQAPVRVLIP